MKEILVVILTIALMILPFVLKWWFTASTYGIVLDPSAVG